MSGWKSVPLEEVADIERDSVAPSAIRNGTLYVGLENIQTGGEFLNVREVEEGELASNKFAFTGEHLLYGKLRPYLAKIARPGFSGVCSTDILPIKPGPQLSRDYLAHFLLQPSMVDFANSHAAGANLPRLSPRVLATFSIPLPPLPEQRRIAAILDQADTLRTQRRAALAQLDSLTQSLFLDMFGDPAINPNSWPVKTLKELGKVITGGTPPSSKEGMFDGPIPFMTPGDLESDHPVRRSITEAGAKEVDLVRAGATLVCCIGATIGKVGIARQESAFNQQLNAVVWGKHINDLFGYEVMRFFKPTIASWGASTTLPILKKSSFERIEIPVPPVSLQEVFANRLQKISDLKTLHKSALVALDELFVALQSKAFAEEL